MDKFIPTPRTANQKSRNVDANLVDFWTHLVQLQLSAIELDWPVPDLIVTEIGLEYKLPDSTFYALSLTHNCCEVWALALESKT